MMQPLVGFLPSNTNTTTMNRLSQRWETVFLLGIKTKEISLYDFNYKILQYFCRLFKFELNESNVYDRDADNDFRQVIVPKLDIKTFPEYNQVFSEKHTFQHNLSILDLLFCLGPESIIYLKKVSQLEGIL